MKHLSLIRVLVNCASAALAVWVSSLLSGYAALLAMLGVFLAGCAVSDWLLRRFGTQEQKRAALEDRVRNPPG